MQVSVQGSIDKITSDLVFAVPKLTKAATVTALNKTNSKIGTQFRRQLAQSTGVAQKHFKKKVKAYRATYRRPTAKTFMGLRSSVPLVKMVKGPTGKYDKLASESLDGKTGADAFMAKMPNGYTGIFVRSKKAEGKSGRDKAGRLKRGRLPITEVRLRFDKVAPSVLKKAGDTVGPDEFEKQFIYDLKRRLERGATTTRVSRRR